MIYRLCQDIAKSLKKVRDIEVYIETVHQDISLPCYMISIYGQKRMPCLNKKHVHEIFIDILYLPSDADNIRIECLENAELLFRYFSLETYKVMDRNIEIQDDIVHFRFKVKYKEYIDLKEEKMKTIDTDLKGV